MAGRESYCFEHLLFFLYFLPLFFPPPSTSSPPLFFYFFCFSPLQLLLLLLSSSTSSPPLTFLLFFPPLFFYFFSSSYFPSFFPFFPRCLILQKSEAVQDVPYMSFVGFLYHYSWHLFAGSMCYAVVNFVFFGQVCLSHCVLSVCLSVCLPIN